MKNKLTLLKEYFGHTEFRQGQEQIIDCLLSGRDALCIMPTGAGKSVCYQIPALMLDGVTLVISPLISLMKDQVASLEQNGIAAAYINSSLTSKQYSDVLFDLKYGQYKIVYVAPERLLMPEFAEIAKHIDISLIAIDEAHCVSQWGQDFRPSYLRIARFIEMLDSRPAVGAFTATATKAVKQDIESFLSLRDPLKITTGFDRPNLRFSVIKPSSRADTLLELMEERRGSSGIIYCATRKNVESITSLLSENGFSVTRYHAGLPDTERRENQDDFIYDRKQIMVATNAFGMGIDKSNVSFVVHYNMPKNIESYYQEAGRAGRDGNAAECILLYSGGDVYTNQALIEKTEQNAELTEEERLAVRQRDFERLKQMTYYSTTNGCLRHFILSYFGEESPEYCGNCSSCLTSYELTDITVEAQKILSCMVRTRERFGRKMLTDILRGSKNSKLISLGLDSQTTYGLMKELSAGQVRELFDFLEFEGYIVSEGGEYPTLRITAQANDILYGKKQLFMKTVKQEEKEKPSSKKKTPDKEKRQKKTADAPKGLISELKKLRKSIAEESSVPAYIVFSDLTLNEMCEKLPTSNDEFLEISGVGKVKAEKYADRFIGLIKSYIDNADAETKHASPAPKTDKRLPFELTEEQISKFEYSDDPITVSDIARRLYSLSENGDMERLTYKNFNEWLFENGYMEWGCDEGGKPKAQPTAKGRQGGMLTETREGKDGKYEAILYSTEMQRLLVSKVGGNFVKT